MLYLETKKMQIMLMNINEVDVKKRISHHFKRNKLNRFG